MYPYLLDFVIGAPRTALLSTGMKGIAQPCTMPDVLFAARSAEGSAAAENAPDDVL